jgi:hypothetical protein
MSLTLSLRRSGAILLAGAAAWFGRWSRQRRRHALGLSGDGYPPRCRHYLHALPVEARGGHYWHGHRMACPERAHWTIALRLGADAPIGRSALCRLRSIPGPVHSRSSGCWITPGSPIWQKRIVAVSNGRIGKSGYVEGYVPPAPIAPYDRRISFRHRAKG